MRMKKVRTWDLQDYEIRDFTFGGIYNILGEDCILSEDGYIYQNNTAENPLGRLRYPEDFEEISGVEE